MVITDFEYKGETYKAKTPFEVISDEEFERIRNLWRQKPSQDEVNSQLYQFSKGKNNTNKIVKFYFKDLMEQTKKYYDKWAIADIFECKEMLSLVLSKIERNEKVFASDDICKNLSVAFSLSGKGMATAISNFPVSTCDYILDKYNVNNVYYDYSCGWGIRLLCSMRKGIEYLGTDPNVELFPRLQKLAQNFNSVATERKVSIKCQGSQENVTEWKNKVGLAFSSPPYFNLEDYKFGNQSWKNGDSFETWVESYLRPTFKNIYEYLIDEGYFIVNIKDFDDIPLEQTTVNVAEDCGFKLYTIDSLTQSGRTISIGENKGIAETTTDENIYVFVKKGFEKPNENLFGIDETNLEVFKTNTYKKEIKESIKIVVDNKEDLW